MTQPETFEQRISRIRGVLNENGITFGDCVRVFSVGEDNPYVKAAMDKAVDGEIEVDSTAVVSGSGDNGDYVMAWMWVGNSEAGLPDKDEETE